MIRVAGGSSSYKAAKVSGNDYMGISATNASLHATAFFGAYPAGAHVAIFAGEA
jgi:hypothetical protein